MGELWLACVQVLFFFFGGGGGGIGSKETDCGLGRGKGCLFCLPSQRSACSPKKKTVDELLVTR